MSNFSAFEEISDAFVTFFCKKLFQSVWTEVVEESFNVICILLKLSIFRITICSWSLSNVEIDSHIKRYFYIVLGWNIGDWTFEPNGIFGHHDCNSLVSAVAASVAWFHKTVILSPFLFKCEHS